MNEILKKRIDEAAIIYGKVAFYSQDSIPNLETKVI